MQMDHLDSLDFESLETCKSYHMGKMSESLVFSKMELESNLLEVFPRLIKYRTLPLPSRLVFALSIDMIGLCLSQYGYSFKENNGYSIFE